mmetsp:Transcript_122364/g.261101  ORF Transcript_122364/g.261101 Transcript_122364/m.261101 type:complete len:251 (-) Transcript_122364:1553-2305(-)
MSTNRSLAMASLSSAMCLNNFSPCPSSSLRSGTPAMNWAQVKLSPPAARLSKNPSGVFAWSAMALRKAVRASCLRASNCSLAFWAERSLANLMAFETRSISPCTAVTLARSFVTSFFWKPFSSSSRSDWLSKVVTCSNARSTAPRAGANSVSAAAAASRRPSGERSQSLAASGFVKPSAFSAASRASPMSATTASSACWISVFFAASSSFLLASSSFLMRACSSCSARFSRAFTSDLAMPTMDRRRGNFS